MGESMINSLFSFFSSMCEYVIKVTTPIKKNKRNIRKFTREDLDAFLILLDGNSLPAKKTVSESEQKARREWVEIRLAAAHIIEKKVRAEKTLSKEDDLSDKSSSDDSVKAKAESSSKEPAKKPDITSEDDSEDEKESEDDEKPTKADTKTTKKESTNSDE
ncbi:unnamed protein product [Arabidopsis arenosa]|uniref:Uncharacterized protein n=1 Tax=Arabidopsis arenosa TaxID=38785 RepID=A0A8S1ZG47_ARAAE|nr:unnamed protein product [Arabidopsis arenosa]